MTDLTVCSRSNDAMLDVLSRVSAIVKAVQLVPGQYDAMMARPNSPHLEPLIQFLGQRAEEEVIAGTQLQLRDKLHRGDLRVMRHYHTGAGYVQLRFLVAQGLNVFYAAITENYAILEGNEFVPDTFYSDFNITH
ncbi:unnamed protein product [Peniophora sp. CBMAI 1063]|nr:unnamed protein product [Peniophora sp. CBMAI 1063]